MLKQKWIIAIILAGSLIGVAGCAENSTKEVEAYNRTEKGKNEQVQSKEETKGENKKEEPEEILVKVMDPTTKAVIRTINPQEMGYGLDNQLYQAELEKWARELAVGNDTTPGYDKRNTPDRIGSEGQIIKGTPRVELEEAELVTRILEASEKGGNVDLPLTIQESQYRPEDVPFLGEVVVATYTTNFNPSVVGRNKNIELSAAAIHNVIVGVNDYFSFNTTVGPSDEAHGYQPAQEAVNGQLVMGIGGGICQTSSTLYNAVDQIGVAYVELHHHSVTVGYVPTGRDATVSYGGVDFRFQNTTGAPFLISTIYNPNGTLTVEIKTSAQYAGVVKRAV
ncbi:VanW family protein [Bacillus marasmi]|uniref:VanW family protein n=1 Tax=Bacillus marasmi TaxID=1926279 RepID=UPI0011CB5695|nr:VanW family protein [Bacillus marasmi]